MILTIAEDSTRAAAELAERAAAAGIDGLMVLPAMRYLSTPRETIAHFRAVAAASDRDIMIYNNPLAYGGRRDAGDARRAGRRAEIRRGQGICRATCAG